MKTKGFHFGFPLEICGKTYYMDINREGVQEKIVSGYEKVMAEVEKAKETGNVDNDLLVSLAKEYIDAALGDGSYDEIFAGRVLSYYDIASIYGYIANAANEATKKLRNAAKKK